MDIGVIMPTHGLYRRDEQDFFLDYIAPEDVRPIEYAQHAERLGFHSLWFSDHVVMGRDLSMHYPSNQSGKKSYPEQPTMFDAAPLMGALAVATDRIKFAPSVHIAPYRHPLVSAHQFATVDYLSKGRLIMAVSSGWEKDEFDALNADFKNRGAITEESIEVYKAAWTQEWVDHKGEFFDIHDVSMNPKPWQDPHPPIAFGATTPRGARRAARVADGLYTSHADPFKPLETWRPVRQAVLDEGAKIGRDLSTFWYGMNVSTMICDATDSVVSSKRRPVLTGTAEQILEDIERFAAEHYQHLTLCIDVRGGTIDDMFEQVQRIGEEVLPEASSIRAEPFA